MLNTALDIVNIHIHTQSGFNPIMFLALPSSCGSEFHNLITDCVKFISFYWFLACCHLNRHPFPVVQVCMTWISGSALSRPLISQMFKVPALICFLFLMLPIPKCSQLSSYEWVYMLLLIPQVHPTVLLRVTVQLTLCS